MSGQDSFESLSSTSLLSLPPDILLAVMAEPFLGLKESCVLCMSNSRTWKFFSEYRIQHILSAKDADETDINAAYIHAFLRILRHTTGLAQERRKNCAGEIFRQVAVLEKIVATMPEPARLAIANNLPALSSRDIFATGTIAEHVITCVSALPVNYDQ